jgi:hypothetical protein
VHRTQRNAILASNPQDHLGQPEHSIHLILQGLPEDDIEIKQLKKEYAKVKTQDLNCLENLHTDILNLNCASANFAQRHRHKDNFPHKNRYNNDQGAKTGRRTYKQGPGNPSNKYNCQYCPVDSHNERDCNRKPQGLPGQFAPRAPPSAAAETTHAPANNKSLLSIAHSLRALVTDTTVNTPPSTPWPP